MRGRGQRDGRESLGGKGVEGKGVGKRGGEGKFRGGQAPQMFFPRTAPGQNPSRGSGGRSSPEAGAFL